MLIISYVVKNTHQFPAVFETKEVFALKFLSNFLIQQTFSL